MIYADYEARVATTEKGERYTFQDKEKMYKFLKKIVKEEAKKFHYRVYNFKGTTK